ncbi:hypothetical protein ACP4OV_009351 [Aristida adscensionis]
MRIEGYRAGSTQDFGREPSGTGNTRINLHALRNKVTLLCGYTGPTRQADPPGFRTAIGLKVVVFLEAKFREIYQRVRKLMRQPTEQKLGEDWVRDLIVNWSAISCQIMNFLDDLSYLPHNCCIDELKTLNDLLDSLFYLHVDAYSCGIFEHEPLPPHPRNLTWYPIDPGEGDGETIKFEEPRSPGTILCKKRVQSTSPQGDSSSKRRRGLQGGGLGGAPHVPACFRSWEQKDDKKQCDDLIEHLCEKLKVKVKNSLRDPEEAPKKLEKKEKDQEELERLKQQAAQQPKDTQKTADWHEDQNHQCTQKSESSSINGSLADDLKHLRDNGFLSDEIITFIFKSFNSYLNSKDVLFVPPSISFFMLKEQSSETIADMVSQLQLASKSLVVFAINDNNDPSLSDGGQHWSLLVLDQRAKENRQFDHYDSAGSMNHASAAKLANVLNRGYPGEAVVSEARTPQQNNGYDCGLYVIGIAKEICRWWIHGATVPFSDYVDRVTSATIATLKGDLIGKLEAFLTKDR